MSYQVQVVYDGNRLIPGPRVQFERVVDRTSAGKVTRRYWRVTVIGTFIADKGSPTASATWQTTAGYPSDTSEALNARIAAFREKLKAATGVFANDGRLFEIIPGDGTDSISCRPRWGQILYKEGDWVNVVDWQIEGEADSLFFGATEYGADRAVDQETWELTQADEPGQLFRLVHSVSAQGQPTYGSGGSVTAEGWQVAQALVTAALGFDQAMLTAAGVIGLSNYRGYSRVRSQTVDKAQGRFSATEQWTCVDPNFAPTGLTGGTCNEEYQVSDQYSNDSGLYGVTVSGTITGLEVRDTGDVVTATRWQSAAARATGLTDSWAHSLAETHFSLDLNPKPTSKTISRNITNGVVTYSFGFDTRPAETDSSYINETITIEFDGPAATIAQFVIPGRAAGPLFQNILTPTLQTVSIQWDIQLRPQYGVTPVAPATNPLGIATGAQGTNGTPTEIYVLSDRTRWLPNRGSLSRSTTFAFRP